MHYIINYNKKPEKKILKQNKCNIYSIININIKYMNLSRDKLII